MHTHAHIFNKRSYDSEILSIAWKQFNSATTGKGDESCVDFSKVLQLKQFKQEIEPIF